MALVGGMLVKAIDCDSGARATSSKLIPLAACPAVTVTTAPPEAGVDWNQPAGNTSATVYVPAARPVKE